MQIIRAYSERGQTPMNITHTILATVGSIIVMFAISKLLGNKQISQLTLFDYINGITIGSIASEIRRKWTSLSCLLSQWCFTD